MMTVRDVTQVFDSYAQFGESMIAAKRETASELGREEEGEVNLELSWPSLSRISRSSCSSAASCCARTCTVYLRDTHV